MWRCSTTASQMLFVQKSRTLENIPPTYAALREHIKRASYQANCWNQALIPNPETPSPTDWGWRKDTNHFGPPFQKKQSLYLKYTLGNLRFILSSPLLPYIYRSILLRENSPIYIGDIAYPCAPI